MRLSDLPVGARAVVRSVDEGGGHEGRRLLEIGFLPGTEVSVERRAPLGDPTVYEVRATRLALRRAGAALVEVDLLPDAGDGRGPTCGPVPRGRRLRRRRSAG